MLKIVATVNNRTTLFVGLDRENTTRIHDNKPVMIDLQALMAQEDGDVQDLVIFAGETLRDAHADLARFLPLPPFEEPQP